MDDQELELIRKRRIEAMKTAQQKKVEWEKNGNINNPI